jgi:hypothetical protein
MGDVTGGAGQGVGTAVAGAATAAATVAAATLDYKAAQEANAAALKQREDAQKFIEQQTNQARGDIFQLFPTAQQARQQGIQSGFNLYKAALPTQTQYFQQGNIQAQNQQLAGLGQIQNAILGRPINQGALKAGVVQQMDYNAYGGLERFRPVNSAPLMPSGSSGFTMSPYTAPNNNSSGTTAGGTTAGGTTAGAATWVPTIARMQQWFIDNPDATAADVAKIRATYPGITDNMMNTAGRTPTGGVIATSGGTTAGGTDYSIPSGTNGGGIEQYPTYIPNDPNWQYTPEGMAYYGYAG